MIKNKNMANFFLLLFAIFILFNLVIFPKEILTASSEGILLWFDVVFPSLFPFLVTVNIITLTGGDRALGFLLSPVVKKLFRVSSKGSMPFLLGFLSGYPVGAKIVYDLDKRDNLSQIESQRIMSFSNNPSLLFVIGTVATGMLNNSILGYILILSTFISSILCGIVFRFYGQENYDSNYEKTSYNKQMSIGQTLNESVSSALSTISVIGGFIIFFYVFSASLKICGLLDGLSNILCLLSSNKLPAEFFNAVLMGILEMTCGIRALCQTNTPIEIILPTISSLLYFGGFSILAQTMSIISETKVKIHVYILSRILGALFAFIICSLLINLFPVSLNQTANVISVAPIPFSHNFKSSLIISIFILFVCAKEKLKS